MKLSARLVTALAAVALLVVALAGVTGTAPVSADPDVDAKIFLTNKWSNLTTNPDGFTKSQTGRTVDETFVGSGNTLYGTFVEKDTSGAVQSIMTNADVVIIRVQDIDKDESESASSVTNVATTSLDEVGESLIIPVSQANSPIVDADDDGDVDSNDVKVTHNGTGGSLGVLRVVPGSSSKQGIVEVAVTSDFSTGPSQVTISWETSEVDTISGKLTVKSTQDTTGITIDMTETGASTGLFTAEVKLVDAEHDSSATGTPHKLAILNNGSVTAEFTDDDPASGDSTKVTASLSAETSAPQPTIVAPVDGSATQDRTPDFNGSVSDSGAGLDVSLIKLYVDRSDDAANGTLVGVTSGHEDEREADTGTAADGDTAVSWEFTPGNSLPEDFPTIGTVDHKVDFQMRAVDLAGNVGYSDADEDAADTVGGTPGRGTPHVVQIDQKLPAINDVFTGHYWDATAEARKQDGADRLEVVFDGDMDGGSIQNTDFEVKQDDGTTLVPTVAEVVADAQSSVFLTLGSDMPSDDTPLVTVVSTVSDAAGNSTNKGSKEGKDSLAPAIAIELSGGSSATMPEEVTNDQITVTVTSDEALSAISVKIFNKDGTEQTSKTPVKQTGGNIWKTTLGKSVLGASGDKSVQVVATDSAAGATQGGVNVAPNTTTEGEDDPDDDGAIEFKLDKESPTLSSVPTDGGTTRDPRPFVTLDFGEDVMVTKATFGGTDILSMLATTDDQQYIYKPTEDLSLGKHKIVAEATDLAGNKSGELTSTFEVQEKKEFELPLLPGWNFVSLPADPADPSINSVITSADVSTVVAYDAASGEFETAVRDAETGLLSGQLGEVNSSQAFWVQTSSFEPIKVELMPPEGGRLPPQIDVVQGWNAVPVIDPTGAAALGDMAAGTDVADNAGEYFSGTELQRLWKFDTLADTFVAVNISTGSMTLGEGYWAFFSEAGTVVP